MRTIRGVISLDLSKYVVGKRGCLDDQAVTALWTNMAAIPVGWTVCVNIGDASWFTPRLIHVLFEHLASAAVVQVSGSEPEAVEALVHYLSASVSA